MGNAEWNTGVGRPAAQPEEYGAEKRLRRRPCLRRLAGKKCLDKGSPFESKCNCLFFKGLSRLLDHPATWRRADGSWFITYEPYWAEEKELTILRSECDLLGLQVTVEDHSPYWPGHTKLIRVEKI